ncbi:MAG: hypothetical protein JSV79_12145 [Armatimonadota bacterium]|nr:MAG: hypothetical protein JSV79_12145 [Armatimonadota bacterium]
MITRVLRATIPMILVFCSAGPTWAGELRAEEATLYVGAPADVKAVVIAEGASARFDLPKLLLTGSVRATQGQAVVPVSLEPVFVPGQDPLKPELDRYRAEVMGLSEGMPVEVQFRTGGLGWTPSVALDVAGEKGRITAQASITNKAVGLGGARVRLMSGGSANLERLPPDLRLDSEWLLRTMWRSRMAQGGGGLQLIAETTGSEAPLGATKQLPLLSSAVTVEQRYLWDTEPGESRVSSTPEQIHAVYSFANNTGKALPEGRVTVSEGPTAVGDGYLVWTPAGETAVIAVGSAQGLTARRKHETTPMPQTWETQHRVTLQVDSSRGEPLTVRVAERLRSEWDYEWDDEEGRTYEFSQQPDEWNQDLLAWSLPVPPRGHAEVSYSYPEPIDLSTLRFLEIEPNDSPQERQYIVEADGAAVQFVQDPSQQRIRRIQPEGHITYRLPIPANVKRADLIVSGANTLRISLAPQVNGKPGAFKVVADLVAIAGRRVDNASNYSNFTFDLTPFLGDDRVAYVLLDNPSGGEAFFAWVEAYRVPEGFLSRGQEYAVREAPAPAAATAASRRLLYSFTPGTAAEEAQIFLDRRTTPVPQFSARVAYIGQKMVYSFTIPPDVDGADLIIDAWNAAVVAVARDTGGVPGEFHEELNVLTLFGRVDYGEGWSRQDYAVDLTPYLEDNPSRTVYVAIYSADQTTGWAGSAWSQIEVAALDDAERARLARIRRTVDDIVKELRARCLLHVRTNRGDGDAAYLYQDRGSQMQPSSRVLDGEGQVVYRIPLKPEYQGANLRVSVLGDSLVSCATDDHGRPGKFADVFRARDKFDQHAIETHTNPGYAEIPLTTAMLDSGAAYIRIRDCAPDKPGEVQIHALAILRP